MKVAIWVLRINNYRPQLCRYTIPSIKKYANKIGATYHEITERKFRSYPITYEKMQLWELGQDFDINILIDADIILSNNLPDLSPIVAQEPSLVLAHELVDTAQYFKADKMLNKIQRTYTQEGKEIVCSVAASFIVTSRTSHTIYQPLGWNAEKIQSFVSIEPMVDEFNIAYNIAQYRLKPAALINKGIPHQYVHHFQVSSNPKAGNPAQIYQQLINDTYKTCIATVGEPNATIVHYAKKFNIECVCINHVMDIGQLLETKDQVLCLQNDIYIMPEAPNVFDSVPQNALSVLKIVQPCADFSLVQNCLDVLKIPAFLRLQHLYNFDVFIANKSHAILFNHQLEALEPKIFLNIQTQILQPELFCLPIEFNYQRFNADGIAVDQKNCFFINYCGGRAAVGSERLDQFIEEDFDQ